MSVRMKQSKAKWRAHRGVLELDAIFIPFVDNCFHVLDEKLQDDFIDLMDQPDPVLQSVFIYNEAIQDKNLKSIVDKIKNNRLFLKSRL